MTTGSYLVLSEIKKKQLKIKIGKLGALNFKKGYYIYVGSAMGRSSTSLKNRLLRHLKSNFYSKNTNNKPKTHWHIDYFLNDNKK